MSYLKKTTPLPAKPILDIVRTEMVSQITLKQKGYTVPINDYLKLFAAKGCTCDVCGRKGTHFRILKSDKNTGKLHLFTDDSVLMTVDHHKPRCIGGKSTLSNYVPLCSKCNTGWKSNFDLMEHDIKLGIINLTKGDMI